MKDLHKEIEDLSQDNLLLRAYQQCSESCTICEPGKEGELESLRNLAKRYETKIASYKK